jgi:tripartite-type tricarboxylate transporter receptor subunit TctC
MTRLPAVRVAALSLLVISIAAGTSAADFPAKPIRMVVPYAPGGTSDILGRGLAARLSERLGTAVIVENKGGAGGSIGIETVVRSPADGYTLLLHSGAVAMEPVVKKSASYDVRKDLAPITTVVVGPFAVLVNPSVPAKSVAELIAYAKANPGKLNFGTPGPGTSVHLATELFKAMAGIDIVHVPYKGAAPALTAITSGEIQIVIDPLATAKTFAASGRVRALAVTTRERTDLWPELPTAAESGLRGYDTSVWYGMFAPAATPNEIVAKLNAEVRAVLGMPEMRDWLRKQGLVPIGDSPEEFRKKMAAEIDRWTRLVSDAGIKLQ